jgi:hypothetical protein
MLHKGGQRAVDEFMSSGLHGLEKRKANALQKAKRSNNSSAGTAAAAAAAATWRQRAKTQGTTRRRRAGFWQSGATGYPDVGAGFPSSTAAAAARGQMWQV